MDKFEQIYVERILDAKGDKKILTEIVNDLYEDGYLDGKGDQD